MVLLHFHLVFNEIRFLSRVRYLPGVNFTNILQAAFSYESALHSFSLITVWLCKFLEK